VRRLRYGLDFLGKLYGKPAKRLRKQAKRIQDQLGEHQDAIIAQEVLWSVVEELRVEGTATAQTYVAIGQAIQREARHAEVAREQFFAERDTLRKYVKEFEMALRGETPDKPDADDGAIATT
jgi:CHAD domain-containing protein